MFSKLVKSARTLFAAAALVWAAAAYPINVRATLVANPDGVLSTKYPCTAGDRSNCAPPSVTALTCDNSAAPILTGLFATGVQYSENARSLFSGTEAATATLGVATVSGTNAATAGWSISGNNLVNPRTDPTSIGSGTLAVTATAADLSVVQCAPARAWSIATSPGGDTTAPGAVASLTNTAQTSSTLTYTWAAATDNVAVTAYDVLLGTGDGAGNAVGSGTIIASPNSLTYTATGLSSSQQYYFRVRAKDAAGNLGAYTSRVFATTSAPPAGDYKVNTSFEFSSDWTTPCGGSDYTWTASDGTQYVREGDGGANTCTNISSAFALSGSKSLKITLTRDTASDFRAEVRPYFLNSGHPASSALFNQDVWYGWAIYIPAGYVSSASRDIVTQWHTYAETGDPTGLSPAFGVQIRNNKWEIIRRPNAASPPTTAAQESYTTVLSGAIATGAWSKWVCRIRWHWTTGESQCWLNGVEVYNVNGGNTSNHTEAPYWKFGDYRVANKTDEGETGVSPRIIYIDNAKMVLTGGSYADVAP